MPFGFICGFPLGRGDLYGGGSYTGSLSDPAGLHAVATAASLERWGCGPPGRLTIPHPVCKRKFAPWSAADGAEMLGCHFHHSIREKRVRRYGLREGWEPYGQWGHSPAEKPGPRRRKTAKKKRKRGKKAGDVAPEKNKQKR